MDNGREVDFAEAMASHRMDADGSAKTDDPPIDLYPKADKTNGHIVAKNRSYKEGYGIFELFCHGNFKDYYMRMTMELNIKRKRRKQ